MREAMVLRKLVSAAPLVGIALVAFLNARAIGSLVDATITPANAPASIAPFAEARAAAVPPAAPRSADALLDRNPFDHLTTSLRERTGDGVVTLDDVFNDPATAPPCDGVRATVAIHSHDANASFAALDVGGKRILQKRGGEVVADLKVVYVAEDRVLHERRGALCQARVFGGPPPPPPTPPTPGAQTAFGKDIAGKIVKTGPNEFQVDRGAVDRILEAQTELMKTPLVPEKEGDRVVGFRLVRIKPGSVLATLGLESNDRLVSINGIEVTSTERML